MASAACRRARPALPAVRHSALGVIVDDETVATFDPDPKGGFAGRVHGHTAGSTTISFILMHGDHAEFTTEPIVIDVLE